MDFHKQPMVKLSAELSERISLLRMPLIVGVVFIHAYDTTISKSIVLRYDGLTSFVCNYVSEGIASTAVPLFFLLAGYLFFWLAPASPAEFGARALKRIQSLLIPMVAWNALCLAGIALAERMPATAQFMSGRSVPVASFRWLDYVNAILGLTTHPIAYQFWFIRDLILLILLSPLLHFILSKAPLPFFLAVGGWWYATDVWTLPVLSREAILFFGAGSLLAIRGIDLRRADKLAPYCFILYLPLSVVDAALKRPPLGNPVHKAAELCGIVSVFCLTRYWQRAVAWRNPLIALSSASFFVFACHEPLLTIVRKLSFRQFPPSSDFVILALYFADPLLVIGVCILAYYLCRSVMPGVTSFITGGRTKTPAIVSATAS